MTDDGYKFSRRRGGVKAPLVGSAMLLAVSALAMMPGMTERARPAVGTVATASMVPVMAGATSLRVKVSDWFQPVAGGESLRRENENLKAALAQQIAENVALRDELKSAQSRLSLANLPAGLGLRTLPGRVAAMNPVPPARSMVILVGQADGVTKNMAVLSPPGVAGVVWHATEHQALVRLLDDAKSTWGARIVPGSNAAALATGEGASDVAADESGAHGLLRGTGEPGRLEFLFDDAVADAQPGELVVTSGVTGSLFPGGLPLGRVVKAYTNTRGRRMAEVEPLASATGVGEVYVLLASPPVPDAALMKKR